MGWFFKILMRRRYRKAKSFERFIELLLLEGCDTVIVSDILRTDWPRSMPEIELTGKLGNFTNAIRIVGIIPRHGRKMVTYEEDVCRWYGGSKSSIFIKDRAMAAFKTLFEAERKMKILENSLFPSISKWMVASNQAIADIERYLRIYGHRADLRVVAFYHYLSRKYQYTL